MSAYEKFAQVYDLFMDNIDYEGWAEYVTDRLREYEITDGLVLELGCGTGTMTGLLAGKGYDMIGVDNSEEMLAEAMEKRVESGQDILYLLQDMQEFELYGTVRAVVSVCDSLNYITDRDELRHVFELVNNYLDPEGIFLFDMNTVHKYRDLLGDTTIAENRDDDLLAVQITWCIFRISLMICCTCFVYFVDHFCCFLRLHFEHFHTIFIACIHRRIIQNISVITKNIICTSSYSF